MMKYFLFLVVLVLNVSFLKAQTIAETTTKTEDLIVPILLEKEKRVAGNPFATYVSLLELENAYRESKKFSRFYEEVRLNFEQFFGFPEAGKKAMQKLANFSSNKTWSSDTNLKVTANSAIDVIKEEAAKTQIVILGEEHHLPQTRSVFEEIIKELWKQGYKYLAAEAFEEGLKDSVLKFTDYNTGYYTQDPIFASAVNLAVTLGFKLVDYDTKEHSATDPSFRDIKQAENILKSIFEKDPTAKVLIIAGRGHASETIASDGWKPMAANLKKATGINPFTVYLPTMNERLTPEEEHPLYRYATASNLVDIPIILKNNSTGEYMGSASFDAYLFFPRVKIIKGRPNWMFTTLKRNPVPIPKANLNGEGMRLVQVFQKNQPASTIPVDQIIIDDGDIDKHLALLPGSYWVRTIDTKNRVIATSKLNVGKR